MMGTTVPKTCWSVYKWINKNLLKFFKAIVRLVGVLSHFNYLEDARNHKLKQKITLCIHNKLCVLIINCGEPLQIIQIAQWKRVCRNEVSVLVSQVTLLLLDSYRLFVSIAAPQFRNEQCRDSCNSKDSTNCYQEPALRRATQLGKEWIILDTTLLLIRLLRGLLWSLTGAFLP
jgi:hypothetical protein